MSIDLFMPSRVTTLPSFPAATTTTDPVRIPVFSGLARYPYLVPAPADMAELAGEILVDE
jgi:hypothetical protein